MHCENVTENEIVMQSLFWCFTFLLNPQVGKISADLPDFRFREFQSWHTARMSDIAVGG
jgi:hypothetical protein